MRTRQLLSDLIEGRLSSPDGRAELVRLATRLIVEEALEAESRDVLGRGYEHGAAPGQDHLGLPLVERSHSKYRGGGKSPPLPHPPPAPSISQ